MNAIEWFVYIVIIGGTMFGALFGPLSHDAAQTILLGFLAGSLIILAYEVQQMEDDEGGEE